MVQAVDGLEGVTQYGYDALSRRVSLTRAAGTPLARTTVTAYDAADQVVSVTSSADAYGFDGLGRVTSVTEAWGTPLARTTTTVYDEEEKVSGTDIILLFTSLDQIGSCHLLLLFSC